MLSARFSKAHYELEALLGDAAKGGLVSKPSPDFPAYVIVQSKEAWGEVAEALRFALRCNLLALDKDEFGVDISRWFSTTNEFEDKP